MLPLRMGISTAVYHWAQYYGSKIAIRTDSIDMTYKDLNLMADSVATAIASEMVGFQQAVALNASDKILFLAGLLGIIRSGNYVLLVNPTSSQEELQSIMAERSCSLMLTDGHPLQGKGMRNLSIEGCARKQATLTTYPVRGAEWLWGTIYTSGTTGRPKGIVRTDLSLLMELLGWCIELPLLRQSQVYIGRPLFYTGGLVLSTATLLVGGTCICPHAHDPIIYEKLCRENAVDIAFLVPDQLLELLAIPAKNGATTILTMGARISGDKKRKAHKSLGSQIIESWGNSEGLGTITDAGDINQRPASIGRPFVTDAMCIVDETGAVVAPGQIGIIAGHADSRLLEYSARPDLNFELIRGELVLSEDLGYVDREGYFYIVGRRSEQLERRGKIIFTGDIESIVGQLECVQASCIVSIPNESDIQLCAAVQLMRGASITCHVLLDTLNGLLSQEQQLDRVKIVDTFNRNAAGKIIVETVRELFSTA